MTVQLAFAPRLLPQVVLLMTKSETGCCNVPWVAILVNSSVLLLLLVKVTTFAALVAPTLVTGKVKVAGLTTRSDPEPVRFRLCGLLASLSVTLSVPNLRPVFVGVKVTEIVHEAPAPRLLPQVLVCE